MISYLILGVFILMILIPIILTIIYFDKIKTNNLYIACIVGSIVIGMVIIVMYLIDKYNKKNRDYMPNNNDERIPIYNFTKQTNRQQIYKPDTYKKYLSQIGDKEILENKLSEEQYHKSQKLHSEYNTYNDYLLGKKRRKKFYR